MMSKPTTAFFVIDVQRDLAQDPKTAVPDASTICHTISSSIEHARATESIRVIFVQHDDTEEGEALYPGTEGWKLVFEPRGEQEWLYRKTVGEYCISKNPRIMFQGKLMYKGDVFTSNPDLAARLRSEGIAKLVICGVQTDFCVRASSLGAIRAGFEDVIVLAGAHSTYPNGGRSLEEIKKEVEGQLENLGVKVLLWNQWMLLE